MITNKGQSDIFTTRDHVAEVVSAILLFLATVASSWSAYQATRWSGLQATSFSQASSQRVESSKNTTIASRKISIDVGLFVQYAAAISQKNQMLADFLMKRFRPELQSAARAWLETKPLINPDAPSYPFEMPQYQIHEMLLSDTLSKLATLFLTAAIVLTTYPVH